MRNHKLVVGLALAAASAAVLAPAAHAEDFGNWSNGCASGYVCFYDVGPADGVVNKATSRDSNFQNNLAFTNGVNMNNEVNYVSNKFTSNISVQMYTNSSTASPATYTGPTGFCLLHGTDESPLSSVSAYRSC